MAMSMGSVLARGVLGAVAGGAHAAAENAKDEMKAEAARIREERLSKLRIGEYQAKATFDAQVKDQAVAKERKETADFYQRTAEAPGKAATTYTDAIGDETEGASAGGIINEARKATRDETARFRLEEAKKSGNEKLIKQAYDEEKDVRAEAEQQRKFKLDEQRASASERLAAIKEMELAVKERDAETRARRTDAAISKALGGDKDNTPAKVREVKWLAEHVFNGDVQQATQFAYGAQDKDRASAVAQMAGILDKSGEYSNSAELIRRAEELVDNLRAKGSSRGGVSAGAKPEAPKSEAAPAKPANKAAYDALPSGALWVNPKDGKTYRKP